MIDISVTELAARYEETIKDRLKRDDIYEGVLAMFNAKQAEIERLRKALRGIACAEGTCGCAIVGFKRADCFHGIARAALGEGKE